MSTTIIKFEGTDRYEALGMPYPELSTMCRGHCEGTGTYPQHGDDPDMTDHERAQWTEEHALAHTYRYMFAQLLRHREWWYWKSVVRDMLRGLPCDGYHFVTCEECNGTGKRS